MNRVAVVLILLASCGKPESKAPADSVSFSTRPQPASGIDSVATHLPSSDSSFVGFSGYYSPISEIDMRGQTLQWVTIIPEWDRFRIELSPSTDSTVVFDCPASIVTRDTLDMSCPTSIGLVQIQGAFTDRVGRFRERYKWETPGAVLAARITIASDGPPLTFNDIGFSWFRGH